MVAVAVAALVWATVSPGVAAAPKVLFHLTDPRIDEASGIATGLASPGVVYVHNDSGDSARFFALDARTGATLAVYTVPGATNVDWEDIAVAPDARGVPSVWLADIGDNGAARSEIVLYRVDEPHVDRSQSDVAAASATPQLWRLRYPGGPADAESLAVSPTGAAYVVTKSRGGTSRVFAVPSRPDPSRVQVLRMVGAVHFGFTGTPGGPSQFGQRAATAAGLSRDGTMLAVRTYTDAYLWRVRGADLGAAIRTEPVRIALPAQPQGEGITFDGGRLLIDSEGVGSAVIAVALTAPSPASTPALPTRATATATVRALLPRPSSTAAEEPAGFPLWIGAVIGALLMLALSIGIRWSIGRNRRESPRAQRRKRTP